MKLALMTFLLFVLVGSINFFTIVPVIYYNAIDIVIAKVLDKKIDTIEKNKNFEVTYTIVTDKEIFVESDKTNDKFNFGIYDKIEKGKTYSFLVYGFRIPRISIYRKILRAEED